MATFWPNGTRDNRPRVTNAFGVVHERYSLKPWPGGGYRRWHTGDDTAGYIYNHVPADGVVVFAGYGGSYGNTVVVDHGAGIRSRTSHGAPGGILVAVGQRVSAGQRLMVQGTTGLSTGVHNHQEIIRPDGSFIAPMEWIAARIAAENNGSAAGGGAKPFPEKPEEWDEMASEEQVKQAAKEATLEALREVSSNDVPRGVYIWTRNRGGALIDPAVGGVKLAGEEAEVARAIYGHGPELNDRQWDVALNLADRLAEKNADLVADAIAKKNPN